jgi:hypothetical protein
MRNTKLFRQRFLGENSDAVLDSIKVGVIGLGGGGSHVVQQLAHIGVGMFELFDPDRCEATNLNRLVGATEDDVRTATVKTIIAERTIRSVNSKARIQTHSTDWRESAEYLHGCDVVFGCVDGFLARSEVEVACRRYLIPYIDIGMDVFTIEGGFAISGQIVVSMPGECCMRCMGFLTEDLLAKEAAQYGAAGAKPQVVWPNAILASTAVGFFMQMVTPWSAGPQGPIFLEYDGNANTLNPSSLLSRLRSTPCRHFSDLGGEGIPLRSCVDSRGVDYQLNP